MAFRLDRHAHAPPSENDMGWSEAAEPARLARHFLPQGFPSFMQPSPSLLAFVARNLDGPRRIHHFSCFWPPRRLLLASVGALELSTQENPIRRIVNLLQSPSRDRIETDRRGSSEKRIPRRGRDGFVVLLRVSTECKPHTV